MGILDGVVEWIAEQVMNILDMINTSVLGALGCDMETFLRYFPAAETSFVPINVTKRYKLFSIYELIKHHNFLWRV